MKATICDNCEGIVKPKQGDFYIIKIYKNEDWKDIKVIELCENCFKKMYQIKQLVDPVIIE